MVRRWSCIKSIIYRIKSLVSYNAYQRLKIFRRSVKFKRFYLKRTRFKRRHLRKLHHKANWAVYYNILKYWTDAIRIARQYSRFQYHYRFFVNNSIVIEGTKLTRRRTRLFLTQDQWVTSTLTRCLFLTKNYENNIDTIKSHEGSHHSMSFYLDDEMTENECTIPALSFFDKQLFASNFEPDILDIDSYLDPSIFTFLQINLEVEIYKILVVLWYARISSLNENVF